MKQNKISCKICNFEVEPIFKEKILNKYDIQYYQCSRCQFIQTEKEYWLKEAYTSPINISDTGILSRNIILALKTSLILTTFFDRKAKFLDYGGGYGILTRLMRDIGFNFYWQDPYTENKVAKGFEAKKETKYEAVTLFEGFEHFVNPNDDIKKILDLSESIIFSTTLLPETTPNPEDWWYYGFEHGQHIAFYSKKTLEYIAKKYNYNLYTDGRYYHILSKRKLSKPLFTFLSSSFGFAFLPLIFLLNKSRTIADNEYLKKNI